MKTAFAAFFLLLLAGCTGTSMTPFWPMGGPANQPSLEEIRSEFDSNGEMIFFTGYNEDGQRIPFEGGPHWIYMHGGACVSCHGQEGKGGTIPHMCAEVAPSITYTDLTEGEHEEEGMEHEPFTDETIKKAIKEGIEPSGEELDPCMPRWEMSEGDLDDVVAFLKTL